MWTRRTLLEDACPECGGEVSDVTETSNGKKFLQIITPVEFKSASLPSQNIYATGPSALLSGDQS
jgi:hypothetical protein